MLTSSNKKCHNQINKNTITHTFHLVEYQHFLNLSSNDQQVQQILYRHFDLPSWIIGKINSYNHGYIQTYKTHISFDDKKEQLVCVVKNKNDQQQKNNCAILFIYCHLIDSKNQTQINKNNQQPLQNLSYQLFLLSENQLNSLLQNKSNNSLIQKILKQPTGILKIQFQSHLTQHSNQNMKYPSKRSYIQMKIIQNTYQLNKYNKNSLLQTIFQTLNVPFNQILFNNPNLNPIPFAVNSYLILEQFDNVSYLKPKLNKKIKEKHEELSKRYTFIFRKFQKLSSLKQLQSMVHQYTEQVFSKTNTQQKYQSENKEFSDNSTPIHHFICIASNSFVPFVLSLSPLLTKQKIINYLNRYIEITHPSYDNFYNSKKATFSLFEKKIQQIKKSLNLLLTKLILQYSKQISSLASQLTFIFQIFQLINQSIITRQFIQKLFQLFVLYGGLYPQILLSAQDWINNFNNNGQKIEYRKNVQDKKYLLYQILSAGKMTKLRSKLNPLIKEILKDIKAIKNDKFTFYDHFQLTKNALTIIAFDLTSKTVRFFNHVTTPQLNILDFLYMSHTFQCIQIPNQWSPYKVSYQNETIFINLSQNLITRPFGLEYLQKFTDNIQVCKRHFPFLIQTQKQFQFKKFIFNGKINTKQIYQERQKQFSLKHHEIMSSLKKLIFYNIPKTKLIWRFIKFQASNKEIINQKSQSMISILRKIQIINHFYNLFKTLTSHQKNLCRQVWLQNQCNFIDSVKSKKNNFIEKGKQKGIIKWQIERIQHLKKTIKNLRFKHKFINFQQMQNIQNQTNLLKIWLNILKQNLLNRVTNRYNFQEVLFGTEKMKILQHIKQNLQAIFNNFQKLQRDFSKNSYFINLVQTFQQSLQNVNKWSEKFYSNQETFSITKLNKFIDQKVLSIVQKLCIQNIKEFSELIILINQKEIEIVYVKLDKYLIFVQSQQRIVSSKNIQGKPIWFKIQLEYQNLIKNIFNQINSSITIDAKNTLIRIYHKFGVKEFQVYDEFYSDFILIEKKIDLNLKDNRFEIFDRNVLTRNKINLVIDCQENSELYISLYLKLIFMKLTKIQSAKNNQLNDSNLKIKVHDFFGNQKAQLKECNIKLQKYFQSFTCSGFTSIAILELILQNNFTNKEFQINQILSKIISYRHLFQWKDSQQIGKIFDSFEWHILQQQKSQQLYKSVYTEEYLKQLYSKTHLSPDQIKQKFNQFNQKSQSKIKNQSKSPFLNKRKQIEHYLFYQIIEEWYQIIVKRKQSNQKLLQNTKKLSIDELIDLKILYNQKVNQIYSTLEKKQLITLFKKFMQKFGPFFQEIISLLLDNNPHSKQEWKGILLKNALSSFKLKNYLQDLFISYDLSPNLTFQELYRLGANKFQGSFNVILWNVRKNCIQVCNNITKSQMPVWFAILSSCSLPFYMEEQLSHKKWQESLFSKNYQKFCQFPDRNKQTPYFNQTQMNKRSSQRQSLSKNQSSKIKAELLSSTIPDLINQECNKYLNPSSIQAFPLNYLTNPYFGMITKQNPKIMTILFRKNDSGLSDCIRSNIFSQNEINVNMSSVLGLYFNKKDKNVRILRQYLRKKLKQTHFYSLFKTIINRNQNFYQIYKKADKTSLNLESSEETRKFSYDMTSSDGKTRTKKDDGSDRISKKTNVRLSKIQIQKVQCVSEEANDDRNLNTSKYEYKFFTTFSEIDKEKQVQLPQLSSKQLMVDFQDHNQSPTIQAIKAKSKKQKSQTQRRGQTQKRRQRRINNFFKKYILNCKCFGFRLTKQQKQDLKKNRTE